MPKQTKHYAQQTSFSVSQQFANRSVMRAHIVSAHAGTHTGSETNQAVRNFANHSQTRVPYKVNYELRYHSDDNTDKRRFITVLNPPPKKQKWDAGHRLGQQLGGSGTQNPNIFPQNPIPNRFPQKGLSFTVDNNGSTKHSWRSFENKIARKIDKYGQVDVKQTLRYKK